MPRGIRHQPVVEVSIGDAIDIPFEFYENGSKLTPIPADSYDVTASFNGVNKFTKSLNIIDDDWALPAEDLFDEEGDWASSVTLVTGGGQTLSTEWFIFRVSPTAPKAVI